jgi:hypothetical protein
VSITLAKRYLQYSIQERSMPATRRHLVVKVQTLHWPIDIRLPRKRFRLLLVGDRLGNNRDGVLLFAKHAATSGMVYFCSWGTGCELVHDLVDEALVKEQLSGKDSVIMTTWHDKDTLEEVTEYFAWTTIPDDAYLEDSDFWLVICVDNDPAAEWVDGFLTCSGTLDAYHRIND